MTDVDLNCLKATCRNFYDEGIRASEQIVREAASHGEPVILEQLANLLDSLPNNPHRHDL